MSEIEFMIDLSIAIVFVCSFVCFGILLYYLIEEEYRNIVLWGSLTIASCIAAGLLVYALAMVSR